MSENLLLLYSVSMDCIEFPLETEEDAYDSKLFESAAQMLTKSAEKETNAAEQPDDEVKFNSKKRKANNALDKKGKVHMRIICQQ